MSFFTSSTATPHEIVWTKRVQWLLSIGILAYILYRSFVLEITIDEAYSYYLVKMNDWVNLPRTANTHWLNSLFIRIGLLLPGTNDPAWKVRLLTNLSFLPYAWVVIQLGQQFRLKWLGYVFFWLAISNAYMITFFTVARGYAPACMFVLFSLYQAAKQLSQNQYAAKDWLLCFLFAALSVAANFSFFYFFVALSSVYLLCLLRNKHYSLLFKQQGWLLLLMMAVVCAISVVSLLYVKKSGDLYYGGYAGLTDSLIRSQFIGMQYQNLPLGLDFVVVAATILGVVSFIASWIYFMRTGRLSMAALCSGIFMGIVLMNVVLHTFLDIPYLLARTALPLFFPMVLGVLMCWDKVSAGAFFANPVPRIVMSVVAAVVCLSFCLPFLKSIDVKYVREWRADIRKMLDYLQQEKAGTVAIDLPLYRVYKNYYQQAWPEKYTFNKLVLNPEDLQLPMDSILRGKPDYIMLETVTQDELRLKDSLPIIFDYEGSRSALLKVNQ